MNFRQHVKTAYLDLTASEILQQPPRVLLGVTDEASTAVEALKVKSVYDLALSTIFANAARIVDAAATASSVIAKHQTPPSDVIDAASRAIPIDQLPDVPITALVGIGPQNSPAIVSALGVTSIRDLAQWPPYLAAKSLFVGTLAREQAAGYDREAPDDLLPRSGRIATQRVSYTSTVLIESKAAKRRVWDGGLIDTSVLDPVGFGDVAFGAVLTYAQRWRPMSVALGQLLHSVPLAPGESTKMAVVDWYRRSAAAVTEDIEQTEALAASMDQSTAISEVTSAVATEFQEGNSASNASSGSASGGAIAFLPAFGFGGGGASTNSGGAATYTVSSGSRTTTAEAVQSIAARTQQQSSLVRNRRAAVVSEVSDSESEQINTRSVVNQNHMHSLSIQYYEVVQMYETEVRLARCERCLFLPMRLVNFRQEANVRRFLPILIRGARTRELRSLLQQFGTTVRADIVDDRFGDAALDALEAAIAASQPDGTGTPATNGPGPFALPDYLEKQFRLLVLRQKIVALRARLFGNYHVARAKRLFDSDNRYLHFSIPTAVTLHAAYWRAADGVTGIELHLEDGSVVDITTPAEMTEGSTAGRLAAAIAIRQIQSIVVQFQPPQNANPSDYEVIDIHLLLERGARQHWVDLSFVASIGSSTRVTLLNLHPSVDMQDVAEQLMEEQLYYSQRVWLGADRQSLLLQLSPYVYDFPNGDTVRIVDFIDPAPVSVAGNYVAFRFTYEADAEWREWRAREQAVAPRVDVIPLPTGGVFAEAVLGEFNAAEKLDATRFWKWEESPIPYQASAVGPIEAGLHTKVDPASPRALGDAALRLRDAIPLPALGTTEQVLRTVTSAIFRDMSGIDVTAKLLAASQEAAKKGDHAAAEQARKTVEAYFNALDSVVKSLVAGSGTAVKTGVQLGGLLNSVAGGASGGAGGGAANAIGAAVGQAGGAEALGGVAEAIGPIVAELAPMLLALL